jgi:hypothetical protein
VTFLGREFYRDAVKVALLATSACFLSSRGNPRPQRDIYVVLFWSRFGTSLLLMIEFRPWLFLFLFRKAVNKISTTTLLESGLHTELFHFGKPEDRRGNATSCANQTARTMEVCACSKRRPARGVTTHPFLHHLFSHSRLDNAPFLQEKVH